jgi:putative phage-type endonuclease
MSPCTQSEVSAGTIAATTVSSSNGGTICPALAKLLARHNRILQHTKLWFTTRTRMITCSDMASVLGENPYSTRQQVFLKKTGQSRPFTGNAACDYGTKMEPVAMAKYIEVTGNKVWPEDVGLLQHPDYASIGGSPDGITLDGILIEIKCPLTRKIIPGVVPGYYRAQLQILMQIMGLELAHFVQYKPETTFFAGTLDITVEPIDQAYWARSLPVLLDFMAEVIDFYEKVNLPIGTPMIDWSKEDPVAKAKQDTKSNASEGRVCIFVDKKLIIEDYQGANRLVMRREYNVSLEDCKNETLKMAHFIIKEAETKQVNGGVDSLIAYAMRNAPESLREEVKAFKISYIESGEELSSSESDEGGERGAKCAMIL